MFLGIIPECQNCFDPDLARRLVHRDPGPNVVFLLLLFGFVFLFLFLFLFQTPMSSVRCRCIVFAFYVPHLG